MADRDPSSPTPLPTILRYGIAVLSIAIATGLCFFMLQYFDAKLTPYLFAVAATVWYAGTGPGVLAIFLSVLSLNYLFLHGPISHADLVYLTFCAICALAVGWVSAVRRRTERELRLARDRLQIEVRQRAQRENEIKVLNQELAERAREKLRQLEDDFARIGRLTTLGGLTAAIVHEVSQPLTALLSSGNASLRWLAADPPNLDAARRSIERMVGDGTRASEVIGRIRNMIRQTPSQKDSVNINDAIIEVFALVRTKIHQNNILMRTELSDELPLVWGDRIQLEQVLLNLFINAIEAMSGGHAPRDLVVSSAKDGPESVVVTVRN
jgi:C4-dicarboxylate-specific signal transduction histidine kinase